MPGPHLELEGDTLHPERPHQCHHRRILDSEKVPSRGQQEIQGAGIHADPSLGQHGATSDGDPEEIGLGGVQGIHRLNLRKGANLRLK